MLSIAQPLSKRLKRDLQKQKVSISNGLHLQTIKPLTKNQQLAYDSWYENKDLFLHGSAGTGKTLIGFYLALREVVLGTASKIIIIRSAAPAKDIGFLPGSAKEKTRVYEQPYYDICRILFNRADAYEILKMKDTIEFQTTSYLRGLTFDNAIVIVDEVQNLAWHELHTVMSRIGEYTRFIYCGDIKQSDLRERDGKYDLNKFTRVIKHMDCFQFIEFQPADVVRSGKARQYILACEDLGYN